MDHLEVTSKHSEHSDIGQSSARKMKKFDRHLEAMENRGKIKEAGHDRPYPLDWDMIEVENDMR